MTMARPESTRQIKSTRQIIRPGNQGGFFVAQKRMGWSVSAKVRPMYLRCGYAFGIRVLIVYF